MSNLPSFTIRDLMDVGAHFGHRTMRWNPKMQPYIHGTANNIHIIDLQKTAPMLHNAMKKAREVASNNGRILFVATKRQATNIVAEAAEKCGQYYVNHRWMGGTLTNWNTVSQSLKTLAQMEEQLADEESNLVKKERLSIQRKVDKLNKALGGIRSMGGKPDLIFVIDTNREKIAIQEAKKLGVPVAAIVDTNCNPDDIDIVIPGNDDSIKSIRMFANLMADAIISGISDSVGGSASKSAPLSDDEAKDKADLESGKAKAKVTKKVAAKKKVTKDETTAEESKEAKAEDKKEEKKPAKKPAAKKAAPKKAAEDASGKEEKKPAKKAAAKKPAAKKESTEKAEEKEADAA